MTDVVLVTGGTGGIGRAICNRLAATGAAVVAGDVAVASSDPRGGPPRGSVVEVELDVTSDDSVERAVATTAAAGGISGVVNCAGILREARAEELPTERALDMWEVNVRGTARVVRSVLPHLVSGASIVNIGSVAGHVGRFAGTAMYSSTKAGLEGLTRVLACELAPRGVRVNCIAPGFIAVPMGPQWQDMSGGENALARQVPLGRLGEPAEIADAVEFLLSDRSSYVTGTVLLVDGGVTAW